MAATKKAVPSKEAERFYQQEQWKEPLSKVITVRVSAPMGVALAERAYREGVDVSTLCRRYLSIAAIEEELKISAS